MSAVDSQHSKNIRSNHKTFAVIYNSTVKEGTGFGVYFQGNSYLNKFAGSLSTKNLIIVEDSLHQILNL